MGPAPVTTPFLLTTLLAAVLLETAAAVAGPLLPLSPLWLIAVVRTLQTLVMLGLAVVHTGDLGVLGLERRSLMPGIKTGLAWSAGFALLAGLLFLGGFMAGHDPLSWVRAPLPAAASQRVLYFFVGGVVAPVAEEVFFRGVIFGFCRRWGLPAGVLISTALFAAIHAGAAIPITQIVGGVVFALAYHMGNSLAAPIVIHMLGNLAIFTLSLPSS